MFWGKASSQAGCVQAIVFGLALQAGCGSSAGVDAGGTDAPIERGAVGVDGPDARDGSANPDTLQDDAVADAAGEMFGDARDASADAEAGTGTGCGLSDGVWTVIPLTAWSYGYTTMWANGPSTFLYRDRGLRKWSGSASTALTTQPPPEPFLPGAPIQGSGENDIWLGGSGPWIRTGVKDRVDVDVTHWDGVNWKDLTFVIPVSPEIENPSGPSYYPGSGVGPFWPVGADEAWQWVKLSYPGSPTPARYVAYHLEDGSWKAVFSPLETLDGVPAAMWGAAKNNVWVGGTVNRQVPPSGDAAAPTTAQDPLLLHWDGSAWTRVELPTAAGNGPRGVASLWGTAANDVWAVGGKDASADTWHFDGDHWTEVPVVDAKPFTKVWGACASDYWAVARAEPRPWHYDGRAWSPVALPPGMIATGAVTGTGPGDVWVSANKGETCTPYEQGAYPLAVHWGRNRCGDGVVAGAESCDPPRTSGDGLRCDGSCRRPACGNGVTDPGEDCDPPNQADGLQCDETCHRPSCGNGVVDAGEECDPPATGFCDRQCRSVAPACGDNIRQADEQCDFVDPSRGLCNANCTLTCFNNCLLSHPLTSHGRCNRYACSSFAGLDYARCWSVLACMMGNACVFGGGPAGSLNSTCFVRGAAAGPCVAAARTLLASVRPDLDTSDPAVLEKELLGFGILNLIAREAASANSAPKSGCSLTVCPGSP
jgi:hypothetical protein